MVTLKEVAAAAQVSTVTASSVLSGVNRVRVSSVTAERIKSVAREMNYVPLAAARGLRTGKTRIIAFVASARNAERIEDNWHESLRGVSDVMREREERIMLVMSRSREEELEVIRQMAFGRQVDGFIVQDPGEDGAHIDMLLRSGRPFVIMGGTPRPGINTVSFDMRAFAAEIAAAWTDAGCGSAALVLPPVVDSLVFKPFREYFEEWQQEHAVPVQIWQGAFLPDRAWLDARRMESRGRRVGIALLRGLLPEMIIALENVGLPLGEGSETVYVSSGEDVLLIPDGLSIMHFDGYSLGRRSARLLMELVDGGQQAPTPTNLIIPAAQMR